MVMRTLELAQTLPHFRVAFVVVPAAPLLMSASPSCTTPIMLSRSHLSLADSGTARYNCPVNPLHRHTIAYVALWYLCPAKQDDL